MSIAVVASRRPLVLGTIMLATFMVAIETTVAAGSRAVMLAENNEYSLAR